MRMRVFSTVAAVCTVAMVAPAAAQKRVFEIGVHGSYLQAGRLAENPATGVDLGIDNRGAIGAGLEWWFGRLGIRGDMNYANSPWQLENYVFIPGQPVVNPLDDFDDGDAQVELNGLGDVSTWLFDANLMFRILSVQPHRWFAPFVTAGAGWVTWDHPGSDTDYHIAVADAEVVGDKQSEPAFTAGFGFDMFASSRVSLRLEGRDYWNPNSPYVRLSNIDVIDPTDQHHSGGNNFLWTAGLQVGFGGHEEKPGFIAAAPEPPPPPPPAPAPPATEMTAMCVVGRSGKLESVAAKKYLETGEIRVLQNGQEVAFTTAYPAAAPGYIQSSSWYMANRPLVVNLDKGAPTSTADKDLGPANKIEFVTYGGTQPISTQELVYVGSVDGTPLYGRADDVGAFAGELQAKLATTTELDRLLEDPTFAARYENEIQTFYMPVQPGANCVFQPMSSTHTVRKTRG